METMIIIFICLLWVIEMKTTHYMYINYKKNVDTHSMIINISFENEIIYSTV